jgi:RNA polymerase sigma factor for flagellar operon FliA
VATTADKLREVKVALQAIRTMHHVALDAVPPAALVSDTPAPSDRLDRQQDAARLRAALDRLPDRERALIVAHYVDGQTLLDAGAALGLSKSWASRLHARAIDRLRELLAADDGAPADPVSAPARTPRPGSP